MARAPMTAGDVFPAGQPTYRIVRFYTDEAHPENRRVIDTGLTLKQAQAHCQSPDTHEFGVWFDGYEAEGR